MTPGEACWGSGAARGPAGAPAIRSVPDPAALSPAQFRFSVLLFESGEAETEAGARTLSSRNSPKGEVAAQGPPPRGSETLATGSSRSGEAGLGS